MPRRKLQVFISATYMDLEAERRAAVDAILDAKHIPDGMEFFAAESREQMDVIKRKIREADVLLIILGPRYGSVDPDTGKSYTHQEYIYALEIKKPVIAMVMKPEAIGAWEKAHTKDIERTTGDKLEGFRKEVTAKRVASFFDNIDNLRAAILKALAEANDNTELVGWVRGDEVVNTVEVVNQLAAAMKEAAALRARVAELEAVKAAEIPLIPSESEMPQKLAVTFRDDNTTATGTFNYLEWFLRTGRQINNILLRDFQRASEPYLMSSLGLSYKKSRAWSYEAACRRCIEAFALYDWIVATPIETTNELGELARTYMLVLTERGRRLLLERTRPKDLIKKSPTALDSRPPAEDAPPPDPHSAGSPPQATRVGE